MFGGLSSSVPAGQFRQTPKPRSFDLCPEPCGLFCGQIRAGGEVLLPPGLSINQRTESRITLILNSLISYAKRNIKARLIFCKSIKHNDLGKLL